MKRLFSPWRLRYITSATRRESGCVFCRAAKGGADRERLVVARGQSHFVILNKYPYNNGHLMVVPRAHLASPAQSTPEALAEMMRLAVRCETALRAAYRPTGINLGMNLGRSAGAGIEGHYHLHVVPRWDGDTNFMTVVHETRVIPESLGASWSRLRALLRDGAPSEPGPRRRPSSRRRASPRGGTAAAPKRRRGPR